MVAGDADTQTGGVRLRITGLTKTIRALKKAGADAGDMKDLMHEVGMVVVRAGGPRVRVKSGRLASTLRAGRGQTKAVVRAGGARTPYAGVQHYGWPAHHIAARPFLVAALAATRQQTLDRLDQGIAQILDKNNLR